jgi:hypothetical protein
MTKNGTGFLNVGTNFCLWHNVNFSLSGYIIFHQIHSAGKLSNCGGSDDAMTAISAHYRNTNSEHQKAVQPRIRTGLAPYHRAAYDASGT